MSSTFYKMGQTIANLFLSNLNIKIKYNIVVSTDYENDEEGYNYFHTNNIGKAFAKLNNYKVVKLKIKDVSPDLDFWTFDNLVVLENQVVELDLEGCGVPLIFQKGLYLKNTNIFINKGDLSLSDKEDIAIGIVNSKAIFNSSKIKLRKTDKNFMLDYSELQFLGAKVTKDIVNNVTMVGCLNSSMSFVFKDKDTKLDEGITFLNKECPFITRGG